MATTTTATLFAVPKDGRRIFPPAYLFFMVFMHLPLLLFSSCTTIDATGERQLSFIGREQEISMGKSSNEDIVKSMGLYKDDALHNYVQNLGSRIATTTERPDLPWTFQVIDDHTINAFAVPGGYVYLTRGILAHFENEAQLAGVLGHEIAHITAKHSVTRMSKSMLTQLGLGIATIAVPELRDFASVLGQGMQLLFLKFSRDDETEADSLGIRYMRNVGENPQELLDVMAMLDRISEEGEGGRLPQWASTHPLPANRLDYIRGRLAELPPMEYSPVQRQFYLRHLDGMIYGANPREGLVRNSTFYHPDMEFQITFPSDWRIINQRSAVVALSSKKDAVTQLSLVKPQDPGRALSGFLNQQGIKGLSSSSRSIGGFPAASGQFRATTQQGTIRGRVSFIAYGGKLFQLVGYTPERRWRSYDGAINRAMDSFTRLQDNRYRHVQPRRLRIVALDSTSRLEQIHRRYNVDIPLAELARLNQINTSEVLQAGSSVKIVEGRLPK